MILPALALLLQSGFVFTEVQPWRWSQGRGEFIPALSATLDNRAGDDFAEVRFLVRVRCAAGGVREYSVLLRDVLLGRQRIEATAYDAIGQVEHCDGPAEILPLRAVPYPPGQRPAFVVFGFSLSRPGEPPSPDLEGIRDYRHGGATPCLEFRTWRRHGARFEFPDAPGAAFYLLRVPPGRLGLAGFELPSSAHPTSPLRRFLRFYDVPPGQAAWLGVFHVSVENTSRAAVTVDLDPRWAASPPSCPALSSSLPPSPRPPAQPWSLSSPCRACHTLCYHLQRSEHLKDQTPVTPEHHAAQNTHHGRPRRRHRPGNHGRHPPHPQGSRRPPRNRRN